MLTPAAPVVIVLAVELDKPGLDGIYSIIFQWKEHSESGFGGLMDQLKGSYI